MSGFVLQGRRVRLVSIAVFAAAIVTTVLSVSALADGGATTANTPPVAFGGCANPTRRLRGGERRRRRVRERNAQAGQRTRKPAML